MATTSDFLEEKFVLELGKPSLNETHQPMFVKPLCCEILALVVNFIFIPYNFGASSML